MEFLKYVFIRFKAENVLSDVADDISGGSRISQTEERTPCFGSVTSLAGVEAMFAVHAQNLVALDSNEPRYNSRRGSARRCAPSLSATGYGYGKIQTEQFMTIVNRQQKAL